LEADISYKRIWHVAYPIILGSVAQNLINITDTAFLGHVGEIELGASALGGMFYFVLIMLGLGFGTGTQIIIARRFGEGAYRDIGKTFDHALYFMLPLAFFCFFIMLFFAGPILRPVVSSDRIYAATMDYIDYRMFGIFFAIAQIQFRSFYIGIASTRVITWSTVFMAVVNIILDYALIFGHWGLPAMGIKGAALASAIAECCAVIYLWLYTVMQKHKLHYGLLRFEGFDKKLFGRNFQLSYPIMLQNFFSLSVWFAFFLIVEKLGEQALAISNIIRSVYIVLMIPVWGFASAANSLVSFLLGSGKAKQVFPLLRRIIVLCVGGVLIFVVFSMIFPEWIIRLYTNDPVLITGAIPVLFIVDFGAVSIAFGFILFNGVLGTGKTKVSFLIEMMVLSVYLIFVYVVVHFFNAKVSEVWLAELVYGTLIASFSWIYLIKGHWATGIV